MTRPQIVSGMLAALVLALSSGIASGQGFAVETATTAVDMSRTDTGIQDPLQHLNHALTGEPLNAALRFQRAKLLESRGQTEAALEDYRWLLNHYPERPEAYNNAARLLAEQGDLDHAVALLEQGMATDPVYQTLFSNLQIAFQALAQRVYRSALSEPQSEDQIPSLNQEVSVNLKALESFAGVDTIIVPGTLDEVDPGAEPVPANAESFDHYKAGRSSAPRVISRAE